MNRYRGAAALLAAALLAAGCARGPKLVPVQGVVTNKTRPVAGVRVHFAPDGGAPGAAEAFGQTDAQGQFTLTTPGHGRGAAAGRYKVVLTGEEGGAGKGVPGQCGDLAETPLHAEVPAAGGELKIEVQDFLKK